MTNPGNAVGTNGAYGGRTSVNAFNDVLSAFDGPGIIAGWQCVPKAGLTVSLGGSALQRDVAIAQNDIGQRTTINNISTQPVDVTLDNAPTAGQRIDALVAYANNPPESNSDEIDNPDACGLIAVSSSVTTNPAVPTESMIRDAITADGAAGAIAYYVVLATINVQTGATVITQNDITAGKKAVVANLEIADKSITGDKIADKSITGDKIADNTITSSKIDFTSLNEGISYRLIYRGADRDNTFLSAIIGKGWKALRIYWSAEPKQSANIHLRPYGSDLTTALTTHVAKLGIGVNTTADNFLSIADIKVSQDANTSGFSVCLQNNTENYATFTSLLGTGGSIGAGGIVMEAATVQRTPISDLEAFSLTCSNGVFKNSYIEVWGHK